MERDWKCWVRGLEEAGWVGFTAKSRGAARYKCWRAANDAGFDVRFGDIRVLLVLHRRQNTKLKKLRSGTFGPFQSSAMTV